MANENPSRDSPSRQQSGERSQTAASQQGTGAQQSPTSAGGQGQYGQDMTGGQRRSGSRGAGRESPATGTSTWQGGRQSGGALQTRGGASMSPYYGASSGHGSGPFSMMRRISDEMDRLFESFGLGRGFLPGESGQGFDVGGHGEGATSMWSPHVEVRERNGKLLIQADLPGMKRDDIHVRVEDDEVIIQGERRQEQSNNERGYYRSERSYGSFYRTIPLPEGTSAESATASFRDGVLEIELDAPREQQRGRTLEIRDASSASPGESRSGTGSGTTYGAAGSTQGTSAGSQHLPSGTSTSQPSAAGTGGARQASGSGTMYSGSGNPSVGAAGTGGEASGGSSDRSPKDRTN